MKEKLQQQIEAYLGGQLSEQENVDFEAKLKSDKDLAQEVELCREMDDLLGETDVMDFSDTLDKVMKKEQGGVSYMEEAIVRKMPTKDANNRRWLSLAASIALVATLSFWAYNNLNTNTPDSLYADNIEFPITLGGGSTLRSVEEGDQETLLSKINDNWQTANETYQQNQYAAALAALNTIEQLDPNFELESQSDLNFKKGLVQLKLDQITAAIASFEMVTKGDYVSNAKWKRALALLKVDVEKAKMELQEIVERNHSEKANASKILEAL